MPSDGEQIAGTFTGEDGREVSVTVEAVNAEIESIIGAVTLGEGAGDELRVEEREPGGLLRLRVKLFEEDAVKDGLMLGTVNSDGGALMLTPGPVWYLPKAEGAPYGVLVVDSMDRLQPVEGVPIEKRVEPATGGHRPDRIAVYLDGEPLGIGPLIFAVAFVRGAMAAYEKMQQENGRRPSQRRKQSTRVKAVEIPLDPITQQLFRISKERVEAEDYWGSDEEDKEEDRELGAPITIQTGNGGSVVLRVGTSQEDITTSPAEYVLGFRDGFWYDYASTLAFSGQNEITGAQLLKMCGYSNPYAANMRKTMSEAAAACSKAADTKMALDTTGETRNKRKGNRRIIQSVRLTRLANWDVELLRLEGEDGEPEEVYDFTLHLHGSPEEALPLASYTHARKMLTTAEREEWSFETVKRVSLEAKQMWHYVLRRIHDNTNKTIRFETLWDVLDFDPPTVAAKVKEKGGTVRKRTPEEIERATKKAIEARRGRLLKTLEKMLTEKTGGKFHTDKNGVRRYQYQRLISGWSYSKDRKTGKVDGIKIKPLPRNESS
ncbi:hypothetical protein [Collinsella tanakaei]|uniref:hypothetical protein n=1 Tax=Collinsella tanakaei TaxID=626935 RepID=UPI001959409E|nr:hypothetical protein [Collinsella tanakaei]MBM6868901.1 hypothetical protein [Collinsella tanakaei]